MNIDGITYIERFLNNAEDVYEYLKNEIRWDVRMAARWTASFGVAYNYSQISYPFQPMLPKLKTICKKASSIIGFEPNNCLINYYLDGKSKMGFHADQTDILEENTGIAIISLGQKRVLRFRSIDKKQEVVDFELPSGSLLFMTQSVQKNWEHAIPKSNVDEGRMSLTFRKIK